MCPSVCLRERSRETERVKRAALIGICADIRQREEEEEEDGMWKEESELVSATILSAMNLGVCVCFYFKIFEHQGMLPLKRDHSKT